MIPPGFEPAIPASERPQTYALGSAATGIGECNGHRPKWGNGCRVRLKPDGTRWRREGKWRGNWRLEWVATTLTLPRNVVYPALLTLMSTPRLPAVDWTDAPADLNGLVRFGERWNLVSARVPSRFKRTIRPGHLCHVVHDSEVQDKVASSTTSVPNHNNSKQAYYSAPDTVVGKLHCPSSLTAKYGEDNDICLTECDRM